VQPRNKKMTNKLEWFWRETLKSLNKLDATLLREIEHFFVSYNEGRGKKFKPKGRKGPATAKRLIRKQTKERK
jgi:inorganic pyrophosphatase